MTSGIYLGLGGALQVPLAYVAPSSVYLLSSGQSLQSSYLNAAGVAFTVCMCVLLLVLPRRFALLPIILTACYMTFGQQAVVAGLHFTVLRMLVVVAYFRILVRKEHSSYKWQRLDTIILLWSISSTIVFTLLWQSTTATINRLGVASDTAGLYFVFRILVRDIDDIKVACNLFAMALIPLAICMGAESLAGGKNPFYALGGVHEYSEIRNGVVRCQGPFKHPILAGTFGAVWAPLFIGMCWQEKKDRLLAVLGLISCSLITLFAGSSGPILTYVFGILGSLMWGARKHMSTVRWSIVALIAGLACVMKDPVWFIFARVNVLSGSTGWHRSNLIDKTIRNFSDWWMLGTKNVEVWGVYAGDITNQYILEAVNGGILTALLFIGIITVAFSNVGKAMRNNSASPRGFPRLVWAVGCALFAHCMTFLSVSYFDQNVVNFYLVLVMATTAAAMRFSESEAVASSTTFTSEWQKLVESCDIGNGESSQGAGRWAGEN